MEEPNMRSRSHKIGMNFRVMNDTVELLAFYGVQPKGRLRACYGDKVADAYFSYKYHYYRQGHQLVVSMLGQEKRFTPGNKIPWNTFHCLKTTVKNADAYLALITSPEKSDPSKRPFDPEWVKFDMGLVDPNMLCVPIDEDPDSKTKSSKKRLPIPQTVITTTTGSRDLSRVTIDSIDNVLTLKDIEKIFGERAAQWYYEDAPACYYRQAETNTIRIRKGLSHWVIFKTRTISKSDFIEIVAVMKEAGACLVRSQDEITTTVQVRI